MVFSLLPLPPTSRLPIFPSPSLPPPPPSDVQEKFPEQGVKLELKCFNLKNQLIELLHNHHRLNAELYPKTVAKKIGKSSSGNFSKDQYGRSFGSVSKDE